MSLSPPHTGGTGTLTTRTHLRYEFWCCTLADDVRQRNLQYRNTVSALASLYTGCVGSACVRNSLRRFSCVSIGSTVYVLVSHSVPTKSPHRSNHPLLRKRERLAFRGCMQHETQCSNASQQCGGLASHASHVNCLIRGSVVADSLQHPRLRLSCWARLHTKPGMERTAPPSSIQPSPSSAHSSHTFTANDAPSESVTTATPCTVFSQLRDVSSVWSPSPPARRNARRFVSIGVTSRRSTTMCGRMRTSFSSRSLLPPQQPQLLSLLLVHRRDDSRTHTHTPTHTQRTCCGRRCYQTASGGAAAALRVPTAGVL